MEKTWRIVPPLALATTLHAMVLTGVVQWHRGDTGGAEGPASGRPSSLSVRVAQSAPALPVQTGTPPLDSADATDATDAVDTVSAPATPSPEVADTPGMDQARPVAEATDIAAAAPSLTSPPDTAQPTVSTDATATDGAPNQDPDRYHARRELSRPPKALSPIDIVFPPGVPTPGRHKAVLAVYIDELGHVRKVRTEGEALPLAFEDAARNAFLSAQFRAGELEGRTVKSYIHVEVVFDEQPEARGLAVSSLGRSTH